MTHIQKQKAKLITIFLLFYYALLLFTNLKMGLKLFPTFPLLDIFILLMIGSIIFLFRSHRVTILYLSFWVILFSVLAVTNVTMFNIYGDLFSTDYLLLIGEATDAFDWDFLNLWDFIFAIFVIILFLLISDYLLKERYTGKRFGIPFISTFIASFLLFSFSSTIIKNQIIIKGESFTERFYISALKKSSFQDYGMLTFYTKELKYQIMNHLFFGRNTPTIRDHQEKSKYFGLLEGKNVITIMVESGQEMGVHPLLTPNLHRMREEGIYFKNNYSVNKSNVSEYIGFAGHFPSIPYSFTNFKYDIPITLPHLLNEQYVTSYFHDNTKTFYQRAFMLPQVGFEHYYLHDELFPEPLPNWDGGWSWAGDYTPDSITIERILPHMIQTDQPFYSFWSTFSTHGPYSNNTRSNRDRFKEFGYFAEIETLESLGLWENPMAGDEEGEFQFKYYQVAMMDFDVALGRILEELEDKGLLEDTIIVLYGDHHAYYHDLHLRLNDLSSDDIYQVEKLYDTILYMWNPTLNQIIRQDYGTNEISTFTSPYIIVPTLLDLLGVPHKSDWYLNYSVFSEKYIPVFYSHQLKAMMNDLYYTIDLEKIIYEAKPTTIQEQELFLFESIKLLQRQSNIDELYLNRKPRL